MTETSSASPLQADVAIVGAGPCGLALAKGLLDLKYSVYVIEKEDGAKSTHDWSKAYSYRVNLRGAALMKRIGALEKLSANSVATTGVGRVMWKPDGAFSETPIFFSGSLGYWLQRPHLIKLMKDIVPDNIIIEGEVEEISFTESINTTVLHLDTGATVQAKYLFGCDGIKSMVRQTLCQMDDAFQIQKVQSPSAGLVFRATLIHPPAHLEPEKACTILSATGNYSTIRLSMLPFNGQKGQMRPMACARHPNDPMFQSKTPEEFYAFMETNFPQMQARQIIPLESAKAWCTTEGSTFPVPRWAGKAIMVMKNGVIVSILGDALHSFPPDLGVGVNSGLADVNRLLDFMQREQKEPSTEASLQRRIDALNKVLVAEARAVCKLIPIGFPYQYTLPHSFQKFCFYIGFSTRLYSYKLFQFVSKWTGGILINPLYPPVILQIGADSMLPFTRILRNHDYNTVVLWSTTVVLGAAAAGWTSFRHNRAQP